MENRAGYDGIEVPKKSFFIVKYRELKKHTWDVLNAGFLTETEAWTGVSNQKVSDNRKGYSFEYRVQKITIV